MSCHLFEEDGYDEAILYMEQWDSELALRRHVRSELYGRILAAVELSRVPPEFNYYYVAETRGMELIEAMRTGSLPEGENDEL